MTPALTSLALAHHPGFAAAGAALVALGALGGFRLLREAAQESGRPRIVLVGMAGLLAGLTVWIGRQVTLIGAQSASSATHEASNAAGQLLFALVGFVMAAVVMNRGQTIISRLLAGGIVALTLSAMQVTGSWLILGGHAMAAYGPLLAATVWSLIFCTGAYALQGSRQTRNQILGAVLVTAATMGLHYLTLHGGDAAGAAGLDARTGQGGLLTLVSVCIAVAVVITASVISTQVWSRLSAMRQLRHAIDAMPDGLAVYDANDRLRLWNVRVWTPR